MEEREKSRSLMQPSGRIGPLAPELAAATPAQFNAAMRPLRIVSLALLLGILYNLSPAMAAPFRAGAHAVDISPTGFPVRVNAMFTERSADKVTDPLFAKALALDDGTTRLVICVVDTCMMPRDLIDRAKAEASKATGVPVERMLVSATHTHSAPSAMGCLGSRVDPGYAAFLPGRISAAIIGAVERLAPARIGWAQAEDWEHTFNRRWIRRPDRMLTDPFGERNVRAHMHPGHESPDAVGPSGPVDPQLSVLAVQRADGKPLALLANYSQHYYGSPLLSSDYYGRFARHIATLLGADDSFVGIMSQGTSGDQMWMDYGALKNEIGYDAYAKAIAERVAAMVKPMTWHESAPLQMAERKLELGYRVPDGKRLAWAREMAAKLGDKLPQAQPEIYALEAIHLHERPRTELRIQALRIGDLGIAALPNEVFAITGLKLKRHSPFPATFNIELANGAEGYIPPPEQHRLGGYTTWAARTAGLETNAEPRIVETALALLEDVAGRPTHGPCSRRSRGRTGGWRKWSCPRRGMRRDNTTRPSRRASRCTFRAQTGGPDFNRRSRRERTLSPARASIAARISPEDASGRTCPSATLTRLNCGFGTDCRPTRARLPATSIHAGRTETRRRAASISALGEPIGRISPAGSFCSTATNATKCSAGERFWHCGRGITRYWCVTAPRCASISTAAPSRRWPAPSPTPFRPATTVCSSVDATTACSTSRASSTKSPFIPARWPRVKSPRTTRLPPSHRRPPSPGPKSLQ
jgi:hypothetical protein